MIAVISEVWPHPERQADYDLLAAELGQRLASMDGFISAERFASCAEPGKFLSLSLWRDEAALAAWRNLEEHRAIMKKGREGILRDYHILASRVLWDYGLQDRAGAPADSRAIFG